MSHPNVPEISQQPRTSTTSVAPPTTLPGVEIEAYESYLANRFYEENVIKLLKNFFKECHYPTNKQVNNLSSDTGLTPERLKNWFKTRRAREKAKNEGVVIDPKNEKKAASSGGSVALKVVIVLLGVAAVVGFAVFLFRIWQKKKREEQHARLLKLFEDDDELEVELGIRD